MKEQGRGDQGFSLIELMIALTVTLIISGAVMRLLTAGKGVFRREPALASRQQNIRFGMDAIWRDVFSAGSGLPTFSQAFTNSLDGVGIPGSGGTNSDQIEIITTADCDALTVCSDFTGASISTFEPLSSCYQFPTLVLLTNQQGEMGYYWAEQPGSGSTNNCTAGNGGGTGNGHTTFPHGQSYIDPPGGFKGTWTNPPQNMSVVQIIRYRINPGPDGVPSLERSAYGGMTMPDGTSSWQPVALGVEDLQVQYLNGAGVWSDTPGVANAAVPNTAVRRVRITLSARATEANLQGMTTSAVGNAVRGQLTSEVSPRTTMASLEMAGVGRY
jgi:prepilin-type N-terminal cleavage/methylation domain-containing protein